MMQIFKFRTFFTLVLTIVLISLGVYIGQQLLPILPNGRELVAENPRYADTVKVGMAMIGLLLGGFFGPRLADLIIGAGKALEKMSATDKIAVGVGVTMGVFVTALLYNILSAIINVIALRIGILALLGVIFIYLGIVAMMSMKTELLTILARGGPVSDQEKADENLPTANCKILDTNVIIDGRIADVCRTGFLEGTLYVPGFVLEELQHIADSGDSLKRARGRRGLDILNNMQKELPLIVRSWDKALERSAQEDEVDTRLVKLAKALEGVIVTNDFNLNKVAALQGVQVLNVNELANALKPVVLPGEIMVVGIVKEGKESNQGVAYLDDGTMIVVEDGRRYIGNTMGVIVTSVLQTVAGKMIFARVRGDEDGDGYDFYNRERGSDNGGGGTNGANIAPAPGSSGYPRRGPGKKVR